MSKVFRVTGEIVKPNFRTSFSKEIRAIKPEHAQEQIYTEFGSKHRAKRFQIKILKIEEVPTKKIEDSTIRRLAVGEE
ncbi:MAG: 50S ribosomal protein L18a [Candidatus Bathyarchaeota archaeon]|nr:MAG: 50S ribosomal protein L18a [Candidatus Bathyarchaeota archaeon]